MVFYNMKEAVEYGWCRSAVVGSILIFVWEVANWTFFSLPLLQIVFRSPKSAETEAGVFLVLWSRCTPNKAKPLPHSNSITKSWMHFYVSDRNKSKYFPKKESKSGAWTAALYTLKRFSRCSSLVYMYVQFILVQLLPSKQLKMRKLKDTRK